MADIGDQRVQPALHAILAGDPDGLQAAIDADPAIVTVSWGEHTLLEWVTQPPHGVNPRSSRYSSPAVHLSIEP